MKISSDNAPGKMQEASVIENDLDFSVGWSSSRIAEQGVNHLGGDGTSLLGDFTDGASTLRTFPINIQDNDGDGAADENDPPLPFTPDPNDEFVRPKPGQLVSYLWKARDVEADTDAAYRVGVVLDKAGKCRFFQDFDDTYEEFSLGFRKDLFKKKAQFRIRFDLMQPNARCYDWEVKRWCTIQEYSKTTGSLTVLYDGENEVEHVSPDDLVGSLPRRTDDGAPSPSSDTFSHKSADATPTDAIPGPLAMELGVHKEDEEDED